MYKLDVIVGLCGSSSVQPNPDAEVDAAALIKFDPLSWPLQVV